MIMHWATETVPYEEKIEKIIDYIDGEDYPAELGCKIITVSKSRDTKCYLIVEKATNWVNFYYKTNGWGEAGGSYSTFNEVGQLIQPYYQLWLDSNNFTLETVEIEESPYLVNRLVEKTPEGIA